jgi:hypothetical protein
MEPLCKPHIKTENVRSVLNVDERYKVTVQKTVYKFYIRDVQLVFKFKMQTTEQHKTKQLFHKEDTLKGTLIEKIILGTTISYEQ